MNKTSSTLVLLLILVIAVLAAFFASAHPDGLEKVAENLGFIDRGVASQSLMTDYTMAFLGEGPVSTALAGIAGILILLGLFFSIPPLNRLLF